MKPLPLKATALFLASALFLFATGCATGLSTTEYNNNVVDAMNGMSDALEETTTTYDTGVPNIVTETSTIDIENMTAALTAAQTEITTAQGILDLKGNNVDQETEVKVEFQNYLTLGETYLTTYAEMVDYYSSGTFADDLDKVAEYDTQLHDEYNAFIDSNNLLADILAKYID